MSSILETLVSLKLVMVRLFNLESLGTVKALFHALAVLASALSPLLFGYIIDWGFGIGMIALISLTMIIIATILPLILSPNE